MFARRHTETIAALACLGYVSTWDPTTTAFGNVWRPTTAGMAYIDRKIADATGGPT